MMFLMCLLGFICLRNILGLLSCWWMLPYYYVTFYISCIKSCLVFLVHVDSAGFSVLIMRFYLCMFVYGPWFLFTLIKQTKNTIYLGKKIGAVASLEYRLPRPGNSSWYDIWGFTPPTFTS